MNRKIRCFLATVAVGVGLFGPVSSASSAVFVWYELVSGDGVAVSSGLGQALMIETDTLPGAHDFLIRMIADFETASEAWSLDLLEFGGEASVTSVTYLGPYEFPDPINLGGHPVIVDNAGQLCLFCVVGPGTLPLMEFNLRLDIVGGGPGLTQVFSGIGAGGWDDIGGGPTEQIHFADSTALFGSDFGAISDTPNIEIIQIPEPASAVLLAFVVMILARRTGRS